MSHSNPAQYQKNITNLKAAITAIGPSAQRPTLANSPAMSRRNPPRPVPFFSHAASSSSSRPASPSPTPSPTAGPAGRRQPRPGPLDQAHPAPRASPRPTPPRQTRVPCPSRLEAFCPLSCPAVAAPPSPAPPRSVPLRSTPHRAAPPRPPTALPCPAPPTPPWARLVCRRRLGWTRALPGARPGHRRCGDGWSIPASALPSGSLLPGRVGPCLEPAPCTRLRLTARTAASSPIFSSESLGGPSGLLRRSTDSVTSPARGPGDGTGRAAPEAAAEGGGPLAALGDPLEALDRLPALRPIRARTHTHTHAVVESANSWSNQTQARPAGSSPPSPNPNTVSGAGPPSGCG